MTYLLSVLNLCDNDNKQINLTDKYVKVRIWCLLCIQPGPPNCLERERG